MGTAELLTDAGKWAVVQLPGRRFPGVVIQGDSLSVIVGELDRAGAALRRGDTVGAEEELTGVLERLTEAMAHYESTLSDRGIDLPYAKEDS